MYIDSYAIIVQQNGDGGDSLQREGMYAFGKWLRYDQSQNVAYLANDPGRPSTQEIIDKFEVLPGIYVRHPDLSKWSGNPLTTSRDQVVPVIAYCAAYKDYPRLWRLFKSTMKRGFFAQNFIRNGPNKTDYKLPDTMITHLGLFIRAGGYWTAPLYPILFITDFIDLIGTIGRLAPVHMRDGGDLRWKDLGDVDDNNTVISQLLAARFKPTPTSWLRRQIYAHWRPKNLGNTVLGEQNHVMGALAWYHRREAGGNPEMAELYRPLIEQYFEKVPGPVSLRVAKK